MGGSKAKILLVDDKPANLLALEAVLSRMPYELILAGSGHEALAAVRQHPDLALILLDVQMPIMDGFETAHHIKQMPEALDVPIIFISAVYTEDPFVKKGYNAGGVDYFSKPFDPDILRLKVGIYTSFRQRANLLRERERQIKESEEVLRAGRKLAGVLESLPVGVVIADSQGRICQTNEEVLKIWRSVDQSRHDCYGEFLNWWETQGQALKGNHGPLRRALEGRSTRNETISIACFDGTEKSILVCASPLRSLEGNIMGAVLILQDLTEHRKIEADFEDRIRRLISVGVELEETVKA